MRQHVYTMFISNNHAPVVKGKFGKKSKSQNIMKMIVAGLNFVTVNFTNTAWLVARMQIAGKYFFLKKWQCLR